MDLNYITSHAITDNSKFNAALHPCSDQQFTEFISHVIHMAFQTFEIETIWSFHRLSRISDSFLYNSASPQRSRTWTCPGSDVGRPRDPCGAWACTSAAHTDSGNKIEMIK
ncbi:hypothetical protein DPMN_163126 [Dreissena polymorpha]|uniref:Uncharacterized protein n=1 Tax=Dreissena polymorpha TaxID=45954 RepID=A0A9D4IUW9_DREPO|nr:hypothetical protein DPMN_163126 [Dreissena polymorpha]